MKKKNVYDFKDCFGCGVCSVSCPKHIIDIKLNENGFYEPKINNLDQCIECGLCLDVCSFYQNGLSSNMKPTKSWAAWSDDERIREACSSGGIGFEIGSQLQKQGFKVIACKYSVEKEIAEHYVAETEEELIDSIGSKYIQSYTVDAIKKINKTDKFVIIGTPCQIDSIRRYLTRFKFKNEIILIDFFCHCVPSMLAWKSYLDMLEKKVGKINYISWRNKFDYGWHDSWIMAAGKINQLSSEKNGLVLNQEEFSWISRMSKGDLFYQLFLGDLVLNPACSKNCKFKYDNSSADIRIGDLWGKEYNINPKGVSALVVFTKTGENIVNGLHGVTIVEHSFETVAEGQMKRNATPKTMHKVVMALLKRDYPIDGKTFGIVFSLQRVISGIKRRLFK